jgi:tetratricopeptide (TPR) repeat protein
VAVLVLLAHGAGTRARNADWKTEETLWLDVTRKSPQNGRGLMNYGLTRMAQGDLETARNYFERAVLVAPNYSTLHINLGVVYGALHQPAVAENHFTRALTLAPGLAEPYFYYARWLAGAGRGPEALQHLRKALAISPGHTATRELLMGLAAAADQEQELMSVARETLALDPGDRTAAAYARGESPLAERAPTPAVALAAGMASLSAERFDEAAELFRQMTRLDPRSADAWNNRGWAQMKLGFLQPAAASFERVLTIDPTYERARNNLALAREPR